MSQQVPSVVTSLTFIVFGWKYDLCVKFRCIKESCEHANVQNSHVPWGGSNIITITSWKEFCLKKALVSVEYSAVQYPDEI